MVGLGDQRRQLGFACRLLVHDALAEKLYYDLKVPLDVARLLKPDDARRTRILGHIDAALRVIDLRDVIFFFSLIGLFLFANVLLVETGKGG